jgi:septum formation inhibitor-activating ATPase MinD
MEQLVESIQSLGYQFILIDCPAGIDVGFINAISPAKEALIVTTPEITSIRCGAGSSWAALLHKTTDEQRSPRCAAGFSGSAGPCMFMC